MTFDYQVSMSQITSHYGIISTPHAWILLISGDFRFREEMVESDHADVVLVICNFSESIYSEEALRYIASCLAI